jgi:hypothetical protein
MISGREIWQCAQIMVKRYGDDAANQAAARANKLGGEGDNEGCAVWVRIVRAIRQLQAMKPGKGERVQ